MSIKRVPLDFAWPAGVPWGGYINPYESQGVRCQVCGGDGRSAAAHLLRSCWAGDSLCAMEPGDAVPFLPGHPRIATLARRNLLNPSCTSATQELEAVRLCGEINRQWQYQLSQRDVDALRSASSHCPFETAQQANESSLRGLWQYREEDINLLIFHRLGRDHDKVLCQRCKGDGRIWVNVAMWEAHMLWKPIHPPTGEGYQVWRDAGVNSDSGPISQVFDCVEDVVEFGSDTTSG